MEYKSLGLLGAMLLVYIISGVHSTDMDVKVKYFASVTLSCDSIALNISDKIASVKKFYWILPEEGLISSEDVMSIPKGIVLTQNGYKLNVTEVDDDVFGYYHCIIHFKDDTIKTVRHGVNIDGADFSELHWQYRRNAMVGGIAASLTVVVICLACLVWHCRFQRDDDQRLDIVKVKNDDSEPSTFQTSFDNEAVTLDEKKTALPKEEELSDNILNSRL